MIKKKPYQYPFIPFSWLFRLIVFLRNTLFDLGILKQHTFSVPVISVGNITVGGTGKTPHIEYLVSLLIDDYKIAVLSRGYKRKTRGFIQADETSSPESIGDEPCQIKRKFPDILVAVDSNRRNGINQILNSRHDIDVILLDDAFQHRYVKPGLSILLIDFNRPLTNDHLLPFGLLREPESSKKRADIIIISKSPDKLNVLEKESILKDFRLENYQNLFFTKMIYGEPVPVFEEVKTLSPTELNNSELSILLVTGIANPQGLIKYIKSYSHSVSIIQFPDHHNFSDEDIKNIIHSFESLKTEEKILITTEKDAVRLQKFSELPQNLKTSMFYIPIRVDFLNEDGNTFNNRILSYVNKNKRNGKLH